MSAITSSKGDLAYRVTTIEAVLPTLATKADLHKEVTAQTWRVVTALFGIVGVATTVLIFAINRASPQGQPQPIVIQLPAQQPAPALKAAP